MPNSRVGVSPARHAAYRILLRVETNRDFAVDLLQRPGISKLKEADRHLATELVMGVLRWRGDLDFKIERLSGKAVSRFDPEILTILRLGIYQIQFLERIPKPAAVSEAVGLAKLARKRSATGLVNAVLRKCERPPEPSLGTTPHGDGDERLSAAIRSLPSWLMHRWGRAYGQDAAQGLALASTLRPRATLRVRHGEPGQARAELAQEGTCTQTGSSGRAALYVESGSVQATRLWREGALVIQDEGSQLVAELVAPEQGQRILDLCAAPGMKTLQIADCLMKGTIVASDASARRLATMRRLLHGKIPGAVRLELLQQDAAKGLAISGTFDRILIDAPCSGTGTLARNPEIKWRLQANDLPRLADMQRRILRNALTLLEPGGRLVYATCSLEVEENEQVVESVLAGSGNFRMLRASELRGAFPHLAALIDNPGYFRTRPDLHGVDGFFAAVITTAD